MTWNLLHSKKSRYMLVLAMTILACIVNTTKLLFILTAVGSNVTLSNLIEENNAAYMNSTNHNNGHVSQRGPSHLAAKYEESARIGMGADSITTNNANSSADANQTRFIIAGVTNKETPPPRMNHPNNKDQFISYRILQNLTYHHGKSPDCRSSVYSRTFHPYLHQRSGILDFHTHIQTNLNILYVGSSVGMQFVEALQQATVSYNNSEIIRYSWGNYHENTIVSQTPHKGTVSGLRVTGLFLNKSRDKGKWVAPSGGGGWLTYDVREMKRLVHTWRHVESIDTAWGEATSPCETTLQTTTTNVEATNRGAANATDDGNVTNREQEYPCEEKDFDVVVHQLPVSTTRIVNRKLSHLYIYRKEWNQ